MRAGDRDQPEQCAWIVHITRRRMSKRILSSIVNCVRQSNHALWGYPITTLLTNIQRPVNYHECSIQLKGPTFFRGIPSMRDRNWATYFFCSPNKSHVSLRKLLLTFYYLWQQFSVKPYITSQVPWYTAHPSLPAYTPLHFRISPFLTQIYLSHSSTLTTSVSLSPRGTSQSVLHKPPTIRLSFIYTNFSISPLSTPFYQSLFDAPQPLHITYFYRNLSDSPSPRSKPLIFSLIYPNLSVKSL